MRWVLLLATLLSGSLLAADADSPVPESIDARRHRVETMTPEQKDDLRRRYERFRDLTPQEQSRLRQLHQALEASPHRAELLAVMERYTAWFNQQPSYRQAELASLPPAERVARVEQLLAEEAKKKERQPSAEDIAGVKRWFAEFIRANEARLLESHPEVRKQFKQQQLPPAVRQRILGRILLAETQKTNRLAWLTDDDLADLLEHLSEPTRKKLAGRPRPEQMKVLGNWVRTMLRQKWNSLADGDPLPPEFQRKLEAFFEKDLTDAERDQLLRLPGEEFQTELLRKYFLQAAESPRSARPALRESPARPGAARPQSGAGSQAAQPRNVRPARQRPDAP